MDDEIPSHEIGDLIDQLNTTNQIIKKPEKVKTKFKLNKDELEEFIMNSAGELINKSIEMVDEVKDYVSSAPESRDVASLAELIKASSSAIESLSKVLIQKDRSKTQKEVKEMDITGKKQLMQGEFNAKMLLSRDDVIGELFKNVKNSDTIENVSED